MRGHQPKRIRHRRRQMTASSASHKPRGVFCNDIQHRLNIRRRTGDDAQDLARRGLLLQRSVVAFSCSSWNSRTFSMAITAWSAKVSTSLICAAVKGRTSVRRANQIAPMMFPSADEGERPRRCATRTAATHHREHQFCVRADVGNVERAVLAHPATPWRINTRPRRSGLVWDRNCSSAATIDSRPLAGARSHLRNRPRKARQPGALDNGVEHRLHDQ